ncbi:MAG: choice-of-anchor V domain-containing protein [Thermoplasmata archaeon]
MRQKIGIVIVTVVTLVLVSLLGFLVAADEAGRFDSYNACSCHGGLSPTVVVTITGLPAQYTPGQTYVITITVTGGPPPGGANAEGGFNLLVSGGTLTVPAGSNTVQVNAQGDQAAHTLAGNHQRSWDIEWHAPLPGVGDVYFTVTGNSVDGDGTINGDSWSQTIEIVSEGPPLPMPPTADVTYPDGGESWTGGWDHAILFDLNDPDNANNELTIWINYSIDGGLSFIPIAGAQGIAGSPNPNTFTWTVPFDDTTQARVRVDVKDPDMNFGTDMSAANFEIDSTPPGVVSASPVGIDVVITTDVRVDFSEGMNQTSAEAAFSLKDTGTWTPVVGTFSWATNTMIFAPDAPLQPGTEYAANVTTAAKDDSDPGNNLQAMYTWTFTTVSGGDTEPPTISDVTAIPSPLEYPGNVNISAVIQDNVAVSSAWVNVTYPGGGGFLEELMTYDSASDRYYLNRSYPLLGNYNFLVWAEDSSGLKNSLAGQFVIGDTTPPAIIHVPVTLALANDTINITATVTDNFALAQTDPVKLDYTNVTGSPFNVTMSSAGGGDYWLEIPAQLIEGQVTYFIWATDTQGNEIRTDVYSIQVVWQDIFPPEIVGVQAVPSPQERYDVVNISATIRDLSGVLAAWVIVSFSGAQQANLSMTAGANDLYYAESAFDKVGTYDFTIWAEDNNDVLNSSSGHTFEMVDTTPPAAPTGLSVTAADEAGTLDIQWTANTEDDLAGYDLYRSDSEDGTYTKVNAALITGATFTDTGLEDSTTYWYKLKAVDDEGLESAFSSPASGTTLTPGEEVVDYSWLLALLGVIIILIVILAIASAMRKKPPAEEEALGGYEEVGEDFSAKEVEEVVERAETTEEPPGTEE